MRKNYIIATAGHVDHGKTSFIKALTGKDCDTHPEEKQRGITIHLGFSHIQLTDDIFAGIVDVPGHKDFIDTMISGINGIDLVLFIVAADEGMMPQSYEHLQILNMLGVQKGITILTKCDLVDEETLFYATEEIKEKTMNSFLENAEIIQTSVINGLDIEFIKTLIIKTLTSSETASHDRPCFSNLINRYESPFRYYPDRFFQVKGFGTVVTGTVLSGTMTKNKSLYLLPRNKEIKIRKMESYGSETQEISTGQRASLNLVNFDKEDFARGVLLCEQQYHTTALIDVELTLFNIPNHLDLWYTVIFYSATIQSQTRVHLLDKDKLFPNETCLAQLHLEKAVPLCIGDKFIIRNTSSEITLGGGVIIDAFPLHHRKRTVKVKELLNMRISGSLINLIASEIAKSIKPISIEQISNKLFKNINISDLQTLCHLPDEEAGEGTEVTQNQSISISLPDNYICYDNWFWIKLEQDRLQKKMIRYLQIAHKNNPLEHNGKLPEEFVSLIADFPENSKHIIIKNVLYDLQAQTIIEKREDTYALSTHKVILSHTDHAKINWLDQFILNQRMKRPLISEIIEKAKDREIDEKRLKQMLFYLVARKRIVHFHGEYLHTLIVNPIRNKLLNYLVEHPQGITVSEFRDLIDANRKICVLLLNIFDNEGITHRIEDNRYITEKGRQLLR